MFLITKDTLLFVLLLKNIEDLSWLNRWLDVASIAIKDFLKMLIVFYLVSCKDEIIISKQKVWNDDISVEFQPMY